MECDNWHLSKLLLGISLLFLWILLLVRNYALLIIVLAALSCEAVPIVCVRQSSFRLGKTWLTATKICQLTGVTASDLM